MKPDRRPSLFLACLAVLAPGCGDRNVGVGQPAAPAPPEIGATREEITAPQLAEILNINAYRFRFRGAPPLVWLEIEEKGQDTLPDRIPRLDDGAVAQSTPITSSSPTEGDILLWWKRDPGGNGGMFHLDVDGRGSYGYGLGKDAFTWGWPGFSATTEGVEPSSPVSARPGERVTLLTFDATEMVRDESGSSDSNNPNARKVTLRLMAEFLAPVRLNDETPK
jgi:hypothetical protein